MKNSEDQDEMPHKAAFHQGLHCLLRSKQFSGTEIHLFIEILTGNPFKDIMDNSIPVASISVGQSIGMKRVKKDSQIFQEIQSLSLVSVVTF